MREQLDVVLQQKVSSPSMDLYSPLSPYPPPSSELIQSIIDLIAAEDYQFQVGLDTHMNVIVHLYMWYWMYVIRYMYLLYRLKDWQLENTSMYVVQDETTSSK